MSNNSVLQAPGNNLCRLCKARTDKSYLALVTSLRGMIRGGERMRCLRIVGTHLVIQSVVLP